jgi:hypothetical protein
MSDTTGYKRPAISERNAPVMRVMATYTDRQLLDALLDLYDEMPNGDARDFDVEGHDEFEPISVERAALREAFRRLSEDAG